MMEQRPNFVLVMSDQQRSDLAPAATETDSWCRRISTGSPARA